jgi:choline dehydrogenase
MSEEFDYIIIGSGAGGGPLAARLAEAKAGYKVLVLEAGGDHSPWSYKVPVFHGRATEDAEMRLDHYVRHYEDETRQEWDPKYRVERDAGRHGVY